MNKPHTFADQDTLVTRALSRLSGLLDDGAWQPKFLPFEGERFRELSARLGLTAGEELAVALLYAVESDPGVARTVAQIQSPVASACCLSGLAASLFAQEGLTVPALWAGRATRAGLIVWGDEEAPLPERTLHMPPWLAAALNGLVALPPGVAEPAQPEVRIARRTAEAFARIARDHLTKAGCLHPALLVIRGQCPAEVAAFAAVAAAAAGRVPLMLENAEAPGLAAWLELTRGLPIVAREAGPGDPIGLDGTDRIDTPLILAASPDGQVTSGRPKREYRIAIPDARERRELWQSWGLEPDLAGKIASRYRQSTGRIAEIGRALEHGGAGASIGDVTAIMARGGGRIDALARLSPAMVAREDIVLPPQLARALDQLRDRILMRNGLANGLGHTLAARYKPGVRALFSGESGTGKTLAAHWLAAEAGLPLYRVDLSAMTSKWIGETEKNISNLLDTAEQGDVLLFFDEADSLFGSRTDVSDAHDRYANSQTNFLLQRIEDYTGVAILATNSRERFDAAFARRLDMVLEFPLPDSAARRLLWDRHLGDGHAAQKEWLDAVAATVDLAGGHIRNVVLAAAARARAGERAMDNGDLGAAIEEEYAKLGRTAPPLPPC
ncbi:ATP-binding protein [Novosphingobium beihaiensis]|uniref:ATP-binding protein n=1 Tax=Novosphingobium beihaiensis TaxID=2930389 RepID=A0ABT0BN81_9SPHN|nr:ATP-binding protein [Novosphingobium beihaiensis]MCJ2186506.1 ATP-binding protein [Novosphingobium beihaiensis]